MTQPNRAETPNESLSKIVADALSDTFSLSDDETKDIRLRLSTAGATPADWIELAESIMREECKGGNDDSNTH